ncbi:MAG: hypothetical protein FWD73_17245 [Polyangiaceae bacterium]|nr:hypothetical protein [Polyangiaceae bacterium]
MTREEVVVKVHAYFEERGRRCKGKLVVYTCRKYIFFGDKHFIIEGNTDKRGGQWRMKIDDKTGEVLSFWVAPL